MGRPERPSHDDATFVSYSANREDVILNRIFRDQPSGFYVDVGAAHPKMENDCKALYDRGWHGINLEPNPSLHAALLRERPRDVSLQLAIDAEAGEARYYEVEGTGLSTLDPDEASRCRANGWVVREHRIETQPLAQILAGAAPGPIDLLKVDVEGWEEPVLRSNDWHRFRPSVILVEATLPERAERRQTGIEPFLGGHGYRRVYFDGLNDFYVRADLALPADCFAVPPNVFDRFESYLLVEAREQASELRRSADEAGRHAEAQAASLVDKLGELRQAQAVAQDTTDRLAETGRDLEAARAQRALLSQDLATRDHGLAFAEQRMRDLQDSVARLQAQCARYAGRLEATHAEREEMLFLRGHCHGLFLETEALRARLPEIEQRMHGETDRLRARCDALEAACADRDALQRETEILRRMHADSQAWLENVQRSTLWRLGGPMRVAIRSARRLLRRA